MIKFTVATPTYNRANVIERVYMSLQAQSCQDFEWIVVDDGSQDNTSELIQGWAAEASFPIRYFYQENNGKHMALNRAVEHACGELFIIADSDDTFKPESLQILWDCWLEIPEEERDQFRGVTCRCYDPQTGTGIGSTFPGGSCDLLGIDAVFKYNYQFDMWGANRTSVMKAYPFPDTTGQGLSFYPESIIWDKMGMKYKVRFIDTPLLAYYFDQTNSVTRRK